MLIFALNCGSSSIKSAVIDSARRRRLFDVRVENADTSDFGAAVAEVLRKLGAPGDQHGEPDAIAHRIVHGGERFLRATRIDDRVVEEIEQLLEHRSVGESRFRFDADDPLREGFMLS